MVFVWKDQQFAVDAVVLQRLEEVEPFADWATVVEFRIFSVNRPSEVLVLNCWVTATKLTLCCSNTFNILVKSSKERLRRSGDPTQNLRRGSCGR